MNRDVKIITIVTAIFGLFSGMFGMLFTLYLDDLNLSLYTMGAMFSASALLGFIVVIALGTQSDLWGRKVVYSASLALASIPSLFVPMLRSVWELTFAKISEDIAVRSRTAVHSTLIFEHVRNGYAKLIARIQGVELTFSAVGFTVAGSMLYCFGFQGSFIALGLMLIVALVVFQTVQEPSRPKVERKSITEMYRFDICRQLKILCIFNLIHGIGFSICHTVFIFTLFFSKKFAVEPLILSSILGIHHFTFGIPLIIASKLFARPRLDHKKVFMVGNLLMGVPHILTALTPSLILATTIWYIHDILGAALYVPAQQTLTQTFSRESSRGKDVTMTSVFGSIGMVVGPVIGGFLADIDISLPFLIGGMIVSLTTLILVPLEQKKSTS